MTLRLKDNCINFSWSPKDLNTSEINSSHTLTNRQHMSDHSYARTMLDSDKTHEEIEDVDFTDIYDSEGNWQRNHMRCIIHVMDCFRISHEAYHELWMVCKGHLLPLWRIASEKKVMSEQIPYIKHPSVSVLQRKCQ